MAEEYLETSRTSTMEHHDSQKSFITDVQLGSKYVSALIYRYDCEGKKLFIRGAYVDGYATYQR